MMQFLKSTLFPDRLNFSKMKSRKSEAAILRERVEQLEKEQLETRQALEEMSTFLSQMTLIVSTLATEMAQFASHVDGVTQEDDLLKAYFPNDDDGYIH